MWSFQYLFAPLLLGSALSSVYASTTVEATRKGIELNLSSPVSSNKQRGIQLANVFGSPKLRGLLTKILCDGCESMQPTLVPSQAPSEIPSQAPSESAKPSSKPSQNPSNMPSSMPSGLPSFKPNQNPSDMPSSKPSLIPSDVPSSKPSLIPSDVPSSKPSLIPSDVPSAKPSGKPSSIPSQIPSDLPSLKPSQNPSDKPSQIPSDLPSSKPSQNPSDKPSQVPSLSQKPSDKPSQAPSRKPSQAPTDKPVKLQGQRLATSDCKCLTIDVGTKSYALINCNVSSREDNMKFTTYDGGKLLASGSCLTDDGGVPTSTYCSQVTKVTFERSDSGKYFLQYDGTTNYLMSTPTIEFGVKGGDTIEFDIDCQCSDADCFDIPL